MLYAEGYHFQYAARAQPAAMTPPPAELKNPLGRFAAIAGLIAAGLYLTGWIYRWAYFGYFQIYLPSLELPPQSFLFVPIQVFFGTWEIAGRTLATLLATLPAIYLVFYLLKWWGTWLGDRLSQKPYRRRRYYDLGKGPSLLARAWQAVTRPNPLTPDGVRFLQGFLGEVSDRCDRDRASVWVGAIARTDRCPTGRPPRNLLAARSYARGAGRQNCPRPQR